MFSLIEWNIYLLNPDSISNSDIWEAHPSSEIRNFVEDLYWGYRSVMKGLNLRKSHIISLLCVRHMSVS